MIGRIFSLANATVKFWPHLTGKGYLNNKANDNNKNVDTKFKLT